MTFYRVHVWTQLEFQRFLFKLVTNKRFEAGVMIVILLNMFSMALEYHNMPSTFENWLDYVNLIFVSIYTMECFMKLIALRWYYFKEPWNVFDFVIVVVSLFSKRLCLNTDPKIQ